ncbi:MAG: methionyl-tRNA formyltransferase [Ramlibacter sp.]
MRNLRLLIIGQNEFGRAALDAFQARGHTVAGVFCAPDKPGSKPDPLHEAAEARGVPVHQFASLRSAEAHDWMREARPELVVMAYVLQFAPASLLRIATLGAIQYHPSLLPRHRGPSAISWAIATGARQAGISIFRPTDGLDEGPIVLQKQCEIGADETLGELYFNKLFPMGIEALLEAADLVGAGEARERQQEQAGASYEGWLRDDSAQIHWGLHVDVIYNLIRACNPSPGAWTHLGGTRVRLYDCRKLPTPTFGSMSGAPGSVAAVTPTSIVINAHGGRIEVLRVRPEGGPKMPAPQFAAQAGLLSAPAA